MWAIFNFSFIPIIYFLYPETKGLHLEQIDHIFEGKTGGLGCLTQGVRESLKKSHPAAEAETDEEKAYGEHSERTSQSSKTAEGPLATNVEHATR